jgi:hypothetical protein
VIHSASLICILSLAILGNRTAMAKTAPVATPTCSSISTGAQASLNGFVPFPVTSAWNTTVASAKVDTNSASIISFIGGATTLHPDFGAGAWDGTGMGIPYIVVDSSQALEAITYTDYGDQSDPGPMPIPANAPIEGAPDANGDRHVLVLDKSTCWLYELWAAYPEKGGSWQAGSGAVWDMETGEQRPWGWTSADAAGLPVFPGLVRYDEVAAGAIHHALRFTLPSTRAAFVPPASHWAATGSTVPMGMRLRLKADFDISGFSKANQVILTALKTYGMILADNGSGIFLSGDNDSRWNNDDLHNLTKVTGTDFEVVAMSPIYTKDPTGAAPVIHSLKATATSAGTELTWDVTGATYLILTPAPGPVRGTSLVVNPAKNTTYTLTATGAFGRTTEAITVDAK